MKVKLLRSATMMVAILFSGLAFAQVILPIFGTAKFGEAAFGVAEPALPVPPMPLWATILLAVAMWVVVYLLRTKES